jgi:SAM-dependent methyltransferase
MRRYTAKTADKHELYQIAVQSPEQEAVFMDRLYREAYGRRPTLFREDFCGTALISCEWVKLRRANQACGVDLDAETLAWGRRRNVAALSPEAASRVRLIQGNVTDVARPKVDIVGAFNFSYFVFTEVEELVGYFRAVRQVLRREGLFVLDAYGGWEAQQVMNEETRYGGFTYVWDQREYNPIDDHTVCQIHFRFPDGSMMKRAFTYRWRLWSLAAIQDALRAAGFRSAEVHWEGTHRRGHGNGVYRRTKKAENTPGWNAYLAALR